MTTLREAAQQALEALEDARTFTGAWPTGSKAITNLRDALAQQDEPAQEPVYKVKVTSRWHDTEPLAPAFSLPDGEHLLYTAPPQRKPLTEEEIHHATGHCGVSKYTAVNITRAVERAHGIKE